MSPYCLPACLPAHPPACPPARPPACLPACPPACLPPYLPGFTSRCSTTHLLVHSSDTSISVFLHASLPPRLPRCLLASLPCPWPSLQVLDHLVIQKLNAQGRLENKESNKKSGSSMFDKVSGTHARSQVAHQQWLPRDGKERMG